MKKKILISSLVIITAIMIVISSSLYVENKSLKEDTAMEVLSNWSTIGQMAATIEQKVDSREDLSAFYLYQNGLIFHTAHKLSPGGFLRKFPEFLRFDYNGLLQDLTVFSENIDEKVLEEGYSYFREMNGELLEVCQFVETAAKDNPTVLLDENSPIYKEIQERLDKYWFKYDLRIECYYALKHQK